jgi:hypothetical protein
VTPSSTLPARAEPTDPGLPVRPAARFPRPPNAPSARDGAYRAAYGEAVLENLSRRLTAEFGRGFTTTNLKYVRSLYVASPIRHALRDESESTGKLNAPRSESPGPRMRAAVRLESGAVPLALALRPELSWNHYRLLLRVVREGM